MPATATTLAHADDFERDIDEAIRHASGAREAVRGLIGGQRELFDQLDRSVSTCYVRGRHRVRCLGTQKAV